MTTRRPGSHAGFMAGVLGVAALLINISCSRPASPSGYPPPREEGEFSVMTYHVGQFAYADRDGDGQENEFKPEEEIAALVEIVRRAKPDILAAQGLGDASSLLVLQGRLKAAGLDLPYSDHLANNSRKDALGLLSRHPLSARLPVTNLTYTIREQTLSVQRGFQQVDAVISGVHTVRIINIHLPAKVFSETGQTEMRRNEARLLATHARRLLRENPNLYLLVCGDFSDGETSAAMREIIGTPQSLLQNIPLVDVYGDAWSHHARPDHTYTRTDFMLANERLHRLWQPDKSAIVRDRLTLIASDHRPMLATFKVPD